MVLEALRYTFGELRDHATDPWWWRHHAAELVHRLVNGPVQRAHPGVPSGRDVVTEDWDVLVVLDACRADVFESVVDTDRFDAYRRARSRGSMTEEWTRRNFAGRDLGDTVYVAANPYTDLVAGDAFHHVEPLWVDAFDDDLGTIAPAAVACAARAAAADYPDKRLVVHFMQPHHPFIADDQVAAYSGWRIDAFADGDRPPHPHDPFEAQSMGLVDADRVRAAYAATLDLVVDDAVALAADLPGRAVVTADHGNMFGGPGWPLPLAVYGHPRGLRHPELVEVPWAVLETDDRPTIRDGGTVRSETPDRHVEARLRDLGYV